MKTSMSRHVFADQFLAIWGIPGYTFKGIYKELQKHLGNNVQNYILAARTAQGFEEWQASSGTERQQVISRWHSIQTALDRHRKSPTHESYSLQQTALSEETVRDVSEQSNQASSLGGGLGNQTSSSESTAPSVRNMTFPRYHVSEASNEGHIAGPSSRNNAEEDELIERAVRASLATSNVTPERTDDEEALKRVVQTSISEANQTEHYEYSYRQQLREALRQSLLDETAEH